MIFRFLLRLAVRASFVALATSSVMVGCSRQGEGERCDLAAAGYDDCDSGLICVSCRNLADHVTDRCCPPGASSEPRCAQSAEADCLTQVGSGGSGGSAGSGAGSSGAGTAGANGGTAGDDDPAGAGGV